MAASVLGKRKAEATSVSIQPRKRRTRAGIPKIHADEVDCSQASSRQHGCSTMDSAASENYGSGLISNSPQYHDPVEICITSNVVPSLGDFTLGCVTDENALSPFSTPTTTRYRDLVDSKVSITPSHRFRIISTPLTPHTPRTYSSPTIGNSTVYTEAKALFKQCAGSQKVVGRDSERHQLRDFIAQATAATKGGCMYISGPPGTGKSALTREIFDDFLPSDSLKTAFLNCVSIKNPKDVHLRLMEEFASTTKTSNQPSLQKLSRIFTPSKKSTTCHLVVLDEIDSLLDVDCDVLYRLFDWALDSRSNLILIGIANALDLTDRFLPRLKSRNLKPRLLPFHPYTSKEISNIISTRLRSTLSIETSASPDFVPFVHPAAIQLCSKKISSQSGDLRKAFSLVRRAIEQVERETLEKGAERSSSKKPLGELVNGQTSFPPTPVKSSPLQPEASPANAKSQLTAETAPRASIAHVARISSAIFNTGTTSRLSGLNLQQKAVLSSLVARENRQAHKNPFTTPIKSAGRVATIKDLFGTYVNLCTRDDCLLQPLKETEFRDVVASLETLGLVHEYGGRTSSMLTPTRTPSRNKNSDDRQIVSGVSRNEMTESLAGPGADLLLRLFDE